MRKNNNIYNLINLNNRKTYFKIFKINNLCQIWMHKIWNKLLIKIIYFQKKMFKKYYYNKI